MNLQVGKRYSFSYHYNNGLLPGEHYFDGILESQDDEFAYLVCRNGDTWRIKKDHVLPYQPKQCASKRK